MHAPLRYLVVLVALVVGCLTAVGSQASKPHKIIVGRLEPEQVEQLRAAAPGAKLVVVDSHEEALKHIEDADAIIGFLDEDLIKKGKNLKWVQVFSAGVDRYRYPALIESDIVLTNAKVIQGPNVADQAMALLLSMTRQVVRASQLSREHDWRETRSILRDEYETIELEGKTGLVVGYGGIGSAIAERAHGFGMRIEAVDPRPDKPHPDWVEKIYTPGQLMEALPGAHVVFLAVPLTDETRGMMNAEAFGNMRDRSYLVNIARGAVVDTEALMKALQSGKLAGAGLDVTDPEPLPPEHPLWKVDGVVITPHMGGASDMVWERRVALAVRNLQAFVEGRELENVVDKARGY